MPSRLHFTRRIPVRRALPAVACSCVVFAHAATAQSLELALAIILGVAGLR